MPRYSYYCEACETTSSMFHSINTVLEECPLCLETKFFYKLVSKPSYGNKIKAEEEPKEKVNKHIRSAREELEQQIKDLKNEDLVE